MQFEVNRTATAYINSNLDVVSNNQLTIFKNRDREEERLRSKTFYILTLNLIWHKIKYFSFHIEVVIFLTAMGYHSGYVELIELLHFFMID